MTDAVVFLIRPGELVFTNDVPQVFLATRHGHQTYLGVLSHHLPVEIKVRLRIRALDAPSAIIRESSRAPGHRRGHCKFDLRPEIDFGFADVEEAVRISARSRAASAEDKTSYGSSQMRAARPVRVAAREKVSRSP